MIKISNRCMFKFSIFFIVFGVFAGRVLIVDFNCSEVIRVVFDLSAYIVLAIQIKYITRKYPGEQFIYVTIMLMILGCLFGTVINGCTFFGLLSGIRRYFRMFIGILIGLEVLKVDRWKQLVQYLELLFYINSIVMTVQFFLFDLKQDWIGGTFGNAPGCNAIQNVLFSILTTKYVVLFLKKECSLKKVLLIVGLACYMSAMAELTIYFLELPLIVCALLIIVPDRNHRLLLKKILLGGTVIVIFGIGLSVFGRFFPERKLLFSISNILNYLGFNNNSTGAYRIRRSPLVFAQMVNMFSMKWHTLLFGFGLGNCSKDSFIYNSHVSTLQYNWMSSSMEFLENGLWGVIINLLFWVILAVLSFKRTIRTKNSNVAAIYPFECVFSMLCFIWFFYNSCLSDIHTSYLIGITVSALFVAMKEEDSGFEIKDSIKRIRIVIK